MTSTNISLASRTHNNKKETHLIVTNIQSAVVLGTGNSCSRLKKQIRWEEHLSSEKKEN